jgi:hypothetical protein
MPPPSGCYNNAAIVNKTRMSAHARQAQLFTAPGRASRRADPQPGSDAASLARDYERSFGGEWIE